MLLGSIVEEALVGLLMEQPPVPDGEGVSHLPPSSGHWVDWSRSKDGLQPLASDGRLPDIDSELDEGSVETATVGLIEDIASLNDLAAWLERLITDAAEEVSRRLRADWEAAPWRDEERSMDEFPIDLLASLLSNGVALQIEEARDCLEAGGGDRLEAFRKIGDPFDPPAPRWDASPSHRSASNENSGGIARIGGRGKPVTWWEAWTIARPWMKDPRIDTPQRLNHPEGWASGEMDMVLRWRREVVIVDIKSGRGEGRDHSSLEAQIGFYDWLWRRTRIEGDANDLIVGSLEGWYLKDGHRHSMSSLRNEEDRKLTSEYVEIRERMLASDEDAWGWLQDSPLPPEHPLHCPHCQGRSFCGWTTEIGARPMREFAPDIDDSDIEEWGEAIRICDLPRRITVRGTIAGEWIESRDGWGETVLVNGLRAGDKVVTIEEAEPGVVDGSWSGEVKIIDAAPGAHRGRARILVDGRSRLLDLGSDDNRVGTEPHPEPTRLGLLPTRATVAGRVISRGGTKGVSSRGRPWSIGSMHLWDGTGIIEVVAFGRDRTRSFEEIKVGQDVRLEHASLTWRDGAPQLTIDSRSTRIVSLTPR